MLLGGILLVVQGKNRQEYPRGRPGNSTTRTSRVGLLMLAQSSNCSSGSFAATKLPALVKPGMGVGVELHRGGSLELEEGRASFSPSFLCASPNLHQVVPRVGAMLPGRNPN